MFGKGKERNAEVRDTVGCRWKDGESYKETGTMIKRVSNVQSTMKRD